MSSAQFEETERHFIEKLRPRFEDKGYEFRPYPRKNDLPEFMGRYEPDAVAVRPDHNIAIEVKRTRNRAATELSLRMVRQIFEGHPDWQLRVFYIGSDTADSIDIPLSPSSLFGERIMNARDLLAQGQRHAAFVISWSLLEAAARMLEPDLRGRPQQPGTVIQALAMNGTINPETERRLRKLIELRNRVVHGDLGAEATSAEIETILSVAADVYGKGKSRRNT